MPGIQQGLNKYALEATRAQLDVGVCPGCTISGCLAWGESTLSLCLLICKMGGLIPPGRVNGAPPRAPVPQLCTSPRYPEYPWQGPSGHNGPSEPGQHPGREDGVSSQESQVGLRIRPGETGRG